MVSGIFFKIISSGGKWAGFEMNEDQPWVDIVEAGAITLFCLLMCLKLSMIFKNGK